MSSPNQPLLYSRRGAAGRHPKYPSGAQAAPTREGRHRRAWPETDLAPMAPALVSFLPPALRERMSGSGNDLEADLLPLLSLLTERPNFLRKLQLTFPDLKLSERQSVANSLARALKTDARIMLQSLPPPLPPPPVTKLKSMAMAALGWDSLDSQATATICRALESCDAMPPGHLRVLRDALELRDTRVAFWTGQLIERGTEVALFDYADYCETLLGATSYILYNAANDANLPAVRAKFEARFGARCIGIDYRLDLDVHLADGGILRREAITHLYLLSIGGSDTGGAGSEDGSCRIEKSTKTDDGAEACSGRPRLGRLWQAMSQAGIRLCVHAVFDGRHPVGDAFARISPCVPGGCAVVPHLVRFPPASPPPPSPSSPLLAGCNEAESSGGGHALDGPIAEPCCMRAELGIPESAVVFGRHGGRSTFDIPFVQHAVIAVAKAYPSTIYFVLLNTDRLTRRSSESSHDQDTAAARSSQEGYANLGNIIHLDTPITDDEQKSRFVRTCDAMLHARAHGETFGLAVAEFAAHGRPVLTSSVHHDDGFARFHIDVLGERGLFYHDYDSLVAQLTGFDREAAHKRRLDGFWQQPFRAFEPHRVMRTFRSVFLVPPANTAQ